MKNWFLLILASFSIASCVDDDTGNRCNSNCTTIQGTVVTAGNEPLKNVRIRLTYRNSPYGGGIRRIVHEKTGASGSYAKNFYIEEDELGLRNGHFEVEINDARLKSSDFIKTGLFDDYPDAPVIQDIHTRDTVLNYSFYIARKGFIEVNLNNFVPLQTGDFFKVSTRFEAGYEISPGRYAEKTVDAGSNIQRDQSYPNVLVSQGAENTIVITKSKNGVVTTEEYPITVPTGENNIELSYDY